MIGGAKGIGIGIDFGIPNQYCRATSKPYIEKDVLDSLRVVASAYGKSNDDADRSIVKNLVDASNPFIISNAAFKLNSGFGEYEQDFTDWEKSSKVTSFDSESIKFTSDVAWVLLYHPSSIGEDIPSFKVRIKLYGEGTLYYNYITKEGKYTNVAVKSEIFETPICYNTKYTGEKRVNVGFTLDVHSGECSGTITQIPSFEGAFVTDGIDDLITSTKTVQEMGITDKVTVVSMIHQIGLGRRANFICDKGSYWRCNEVANTGEGKTGIYGYSSTNISVNTPNIINNVLGDKVDYSVTGDRNNLTPSQFSVVGYISSGGKISYTSSVAWYWTIIANKVLTSDQINQVIAYFNLDRTLKPDIRCNIERQGITNDNHADFNDRLIDYSGNGRDIQMYNLVWKGGSGIAAKPYETIKDYKQYEDNLYQEVIIHNEFSYTTKSKLADRYWAIQSNRKDNESLVVTIITDKDCEWMCNSQLFNSEGVQEGNLKKKQNVFANTPTEVTIAGRGYFEIPEGYTTYSAASYINLPYSNGEVTVTFIPSCKGGILLDGINDFGKVIDMPIYKDYTFIIDRQIIFIGDTAGVVASKSEDSSDATKHGAFIFEYLVAPDNISTWSFYKDNGKVANTDFTRGISYQSKYSYNGKDLTAGTSKDSDKLWLGTYRDSDSRFFNGAIYSLMSFPYSMSEFLIERQLKKHKLGTLYPDMVEFRPIVKSNLPYSSITYSVNPGEYISVDSMVTITVTLPNTSDKLMEVSCNAISDISISGDNGVYEITGKIVKSPQKINLVISSYLTMLNNETLISNETLIKNE